MPNGNGKIELLKSVAEFMFQQARLLVQTGIGHDIHGVDLGVPGELDNIPSDTETYRWAQASAVFLRYLANILAYVLQEGQENEVPRILGSVDDILDEFDNNHNGL